MPFRRLAIVLLLLAAGATAAGQPPGAHVTVVVFWGEGCPYCEDQKPFLDALQAEYPGLEVLEFEVWRSREHHALFRTLADAHGIRGGSVPTTFVGGRAFVGDSPQVRAQIRATVAYCVRAQCPDALHAVAVQPGPDERDRLSLPLLGEVDLTLQPLLVTTALIAFVDGFNPCSLWVLTMLLALVVQSGSRRRILLVGVAFLLTTAAVYGLFIAGVFGALSYVLYYDWVRALVVLLALVFALVNIKDYFWFRRGVSLTIADEHKPWIYRRMRALRDARLSVPSLLGATVVMALGIALVELPCTAGFPVLWASIVADRQPEAWSFVALLGVYLLIYLGLELMIFIAAVVTLRMGRVGERHGQLLKLFGGAVMLALAGVLLVAPAMMDRLSSVVLIFVLAVLVAVMIDVMCRLVGRAA